MSDDIIDDSTDLVMVRWFVVGKQWNHHHQGGVENIGGSSLRLCMIDQCELMLLLVVYSKNFDRGIKLYGAVIRPQHSFGMLPITWDLCVFTNMHLFRTISDR